MTFGANCVLYPTYAISIKACNMNQDRTLHLCNRRDDFQNHYPLVHFCNLPKSKAILPRRPAQIAKNPAQQPVHSDSGNDDSDVDLHSDVLHSGHTTPSAAVQWYSSTCTHHRRRPRRSRRQHYNRKVRFH